MTIVKQTGKFLKFARSPFNAVYLIAWGSILLGYWRGINNHIPVLGNFTDQLEFLMVIIPVFLSLPKIFKKLNASYLIFIFCSILVYLTQWAFFPENGDELSKRAINFFFIVLPYFIVGSTLDLKKYLVPFHCISVIVIYIAAFYSLIYAQSQSYVGDVKTSDYNMAQAYAVLPHVLMVSWFALKKFNLFKLINMIIGIGIIMSYGTRGPMICTISFIIIYLFIFKQVNHRSVLLILTFFTGYLIISYITPIMIFCQVLFGNLGMSTRIFDKYLTDEIAQSHSRENISDTLIDEMYAHDDIIGHGLLGSYQYVQTYPHNIVIEFLFSFGYVFGTILLLLLVRLITITFWRFRKSESGVFVLLLFCASIIKLCLSGTFLDDTLFFMLIGYCFQLLSRYRVSAKKAVYL